MPTEFIDALPALVRRDAESGWIEASQGLDASAKIYGFVGCVTLLLSYRVDALHSETYKIRGGLYRNTKDDTKNEDNDEDKDKDKDKSAGASKRKARVALR